MGGYNLWKGVAGGTDTLTLISGSTLDMSGCSATAGFKPPAAAGAAPTTDGVLAYDSTAKRLVSGDGAATHTYVARDDSGTIPSAALTLTTATSSLATNDTSHTAGAWNDVGVSVSLAAGTWLVLAALNGRAITTSGDRYGRIRNTTDGADVSLGGVNAADTINFSIALPPQIVVLAGTKTLALEYYARNVGDYVYGNPGSLGTPGSSIVAVQIG